jgi:hypothetical protein
MARYLISLVKEDNFPKFLTHTKVHANQQIEDDELPDDNIGKQNNDFAIIERDE